MNNIFMLIGCLSTLVLFQNPLNAARVDAQIVKDLDVADFYAGCGCGGAPAEQPPVELPADTDS